MGSDLLFGTDDKPIGKSQIIRGDSVKEYGFCAADGHICVGSIDTSQKCDIIQFDSACGGTCDTGKTCVFSVDIDFRKVVCIKGGVAQLGVLFNIQLHFC